MGSDKELTVIQLWICVGRPKMCYVFYRKEWNNKAWLLPLAYTGRSILPPSSSPPPLALSAEPQTLPWSLGEEGCSDGKAPRTLMYCCMAVNSGPLCSPAGFQPLPSLRAELPQASVVPDLPSFPCAGCRHQVIRYATSQLVPVSCCCTVRMCTVLEGAALCCVLKGQWKSKTCPKPANVCWKDPRMAARTGQCSCLALQCVLKHSNISHLELSWFRVVIKMKCTANTYNFAGIALNAMDTFNNVSVSTSLCAILI